MNILDLYAKVVRRLRGTDLTSSVIHPTSKVEPGSRVLHSRFDRHSYCGYNCTILYTDVDSFCSLANDVSIGGAHHPLEFVSTSPVFLSHTDSVRTKFARHDFLPVIRTRIGNDVWIGEGCHIKAGVKVGNGAVIGMGSVVTHDVPDYAIVAGNPARLIRLRFSQPIVNGLLKLGWWNMSDADLLRIGPLMPDPEALLRQEGLL